MNRAKVRGFAVTTAVGLFGIASALAVISVQTYRVSELKRELAQQKLDLATAALRRIDAAQGETIRLQGVLDDELQQRAIRSEQTRAELAASDDALERLRGQLTRANGRVAVSQDSIETCRARESATGELLATCAAEYRFMGEKAAGHSNDALTFERAWPVITNDGESGEAR
jgi:hypothetical protein